MKKLLLLAPLTLAGVSAFALPDYEPFADSTGSGGTSYTPGTALTNQITAAGRTWTQAGPLNANYPKVGTGSLTVPGLLSSGGNSALFGGNGTSARFNLSSSANSGTVYYSFSFKLTDLTGLNAGGVFWAGFNNATGGQTTTPSVVGTRVVTRTAGAGLFNVGLDKSSGVTGNFQFAPGNFSSSDTIFIVGSYTFNPSTADDVSQMWVNPDSSSFGGSAPASPLSSTSGGDIPAVGSFVLFDRNANEPAGIELDDLRVGLTYADVTPAAPEPTTWMLGLLGMAGCATKRFFRK